MKRACHTMLSISRLRAVRVLSLLGTASILFAASCDEAEGGGAVPCVSDTECGVVCAADCADDPVLSAVCDDSSNTCVCECDLSGTGGSGGNGGVGGSGDGSGGMGGGTGGGGGAEACGGDTVCDPAFPSECGTLCQDICGGFENFDSAGCGDDNRCFCSCVEGACSDPV